MDSHFRGNDKYFIFEITFRVFKTCNRESVMFRRLSNREKVIFAVASLAVTLATVYRGIIMPLQAKLDSLDREIALREELIAQDTAILRTSNGIETRYEAYRALFRQNGTNDEAASWVLAEIESVAGKLGLHVMDLKPHKSEQKEYERQFAVSLTINGGLIDVTRFLYLLQQKPYFFDVEDVSFEKFMRHDAAVVTTRLVLSRSYISSNDEDERAKKPNL